MRPEERAARWHEVWERRRRRCAEQDEVEPWRASLPPAALAILQEARTLASVEDPARHAEANVEELIDRVNALEDPAPLLLHGPVCNGLTMLRCAAQELLSARRGVGPATPPLARAGVGPPRPGRRRFDWVLVVGDADELVELANECSGDLAGEPAIRTAATLEEALDRLGRRDGAGIVVTNLTLRSASGQGPHGLMVAAEARRRRHPVLLVTAAGDYLHYWQRLAECGLTGHDVLIKTRRDFAARLRQRAREISEPAPIALSYDQDTGHVVWIGDVEVSRLEAQEALVLSALTGRWRDSGRIVDACDETDLAPSPGSVPPLISTLRQKLADAMVEAESQNAPDVVIESRRLDGQATEYRLAPWLRWGEPPQPCGAAGALPPLLVIEDDADWAFWMSTWLEALGWPATVVDTPDAVREALAGGTRPILVADLALRDAATGICDPEVGLALIEEVAARHPGVRVVVLSAFGGRDVMRARLFAAGVRTIDIIDKAASRAECEAVLLTSLQRAADEVRRGVRRAHQKAPARRVHRLERDRIEVDGHPVARLSPREADLLDVLIGSPNRPVRAELLEYECFPEEPRPHAGARYNPLNKVQLTVKRLRQKIDRAGVGQAVGESVIRTASRGAVTTYELHGLVTDLVERARTPVDD